MTVPLLFRVQRELREDEDVSGTTLGVALVLTTYANMDGTGVRPTIPTIAAALGFKVTSRGTNSAVAAALATLRRLGYLEVTTPGRPGRATEYRLRSRLAPVVDISASIRQDGGTPSVRTDAFHPSGRMLSIREDGYHQPRTNPTPPQGPGGGDVELVALAYEIDSRSAASMLDAAASDPETRSSAVGRLVKAGSATAYGLEMLEGHLERERAQRASEREWATRTQPGCEHGTPAGRYPNPTHPDTPLCALCRHAGIAPAVAGPDRYGSGLEEGGSHDGHALGRMAASR